LNSWTESSSRQAPNRAQAPKRALRFASALAALALACAGARAQTAKPATVEYKPTPAASCDFLASVRFGPDFSNGGPLPHELGGQIAEARTACEQAVADQPKSARHWGELARVRAFAGDGPGALEAARKGAELGSATAELVWAVMLADGVQLPRDYVAAHDHLLRAAKQGSPYAHFDLGVLAANGWGVVQDDADARAAFYKAAEGRDPLAMQLVARRYDPGQAERWLRKAAEAMYPDLGRNPLRIASFGRAAPDGAALVAWYEAQARAGELWAQTYVGLLYEAGQWVPQDYAAAILRYRPAGEAGYYPAQLRMAMLYRDGRGVPRDPAESRRWALLQQTQRCDSLEKADPAANACDSLAADRFDPDRVVAGVDSFCMRRFAERAVPACTAAVKQSPATVRYRSQLARALAHTGRFEEARREARAAAGAGSSSAMILMGAMSQRGLGGPVDEKDALAWYRKAAEAGNQRGVSLVMTSLYSGVGVAKGSPEANAIAADMRPRVQVTSAPTINQQAEKGDPHAQHNVASMLEREGKYDEAIKWYTRAADQGYRPSQMNIAQMYEKGMGVVKDTQEARKRYRRIAEQGDREARYRVAKLAAEAGDNAEAVPVYERAIRDDDVRAMLDLGEMYESGRGVPKDGARAVALYERAADQSRWARYKLGVVYAEGKLVPLDYTKARYWSERSAADHNPEAQNNLGVLYERGLGVKVDYAKARGLYLEAVRGGDPYARNNLDKLMADGRGAPSGAAALDWYRESAEAGIPSAQYRLGTMYAKGEDVARDENVALDWFTKAARQGHPQARREAGDIYFRRDKLYEAMEFGDERAARAFAARILASGNPEGARLFMREFEAHEQSIRSRPEPARGFALAVADDPARKIAFRLAVAPSVQGIGIDPSIASPFDVILWFPEPKPK